MSDNDTYNSNNTFSEINNIFMSYQNFIFPDVSTARRSSVSRVMRFE